MDFKELQEKVYNNASTYSNNFCVSIDENFSLIKL